MRNEARVKEPLRADWLLQFPKNWILPTSPDRGTMESRSGPAAQQRARQGGELWVSIPVARSSEQDSGLSLSFLLPPRAVHSRGQTTSAQAVNNPSSKASSPERKSLEVDQLPAETKANILMARGEYAAAIVAFQQSNLKSAIVWNNIGMAYHHLFALDEAQGLSTGAGHQPSLCSCFQ